MHLLTPYGHQIPPWAFWENEFTTDELNWLQNKARHAGQSGVVGGGGLGRIDTGTRRSKIEWMRKDADCEWVFEKLSHVVSSINSQFYKFNLTGFGEPLQLTNYDSDDNGMYGWHQDYNGRISRKLSVVIQLSDPSEYEGGNLQIFTDGKPETIRKQKGLIALFPSYTLHQVTPVTQGNRQTLVAWVSGPAFR